jgi:type I restriction enzyme S subunit
MSWKPRPLKDVCIRITKGTTPTTLGYSFLSSGINFIKAESVTHDGRIDTSKFSFIAEKTHDALSRSKLEEFDVLISIAGMFLGKTAVVKSEHLPANTNQAVGIIRVDPRLANPLFVHYLFQLPHTRAIVNSINGQAAQPNINLKQIGELEFHFPPRTQQDKIVNTLSTYDDLIENNLRRIQLLEEAGRCEYRLLIETHETRQSEVKDLAKLIGGFAFKSKDWTDAGCPVIKIKNIDTNTVDVENCDYVPESVADLAKKYELFEGNLLIAMTGATVGKIGLMPRLQKRYFLNQRVGLFRSTKEFDVTPLLFCAFNESNVQQQVLNLAGGAAQPNISGGQIESIKICVPIESTVLEEFCKSTEHSFRMIANLKSQNHLLRAARDILLPRLMSGEIDVSQNSVAKAEVLQPVETR